MDYLDDLESRSVYVIREAYHRFKRIAMLWSVGKDSTTLLWLCRKAFLGRVPFPVVHIDTGYKFPDMYKFRDEKAREWNLDLIVGQNKEAKSAGVGPHSGAKLDCCTALKTEALRQVIREHKFEAILLGIRRDEHGIRAKERYFSPRDESFQWDYTNQPAELWDQYKSLSDDRQHVRIHPLLHMSELDIWRYVKRENLPFTHLYLAKNGKRYRSIGCVTCCSPVASNAATIDDIIEELRTSKVSERSGRAQDKEDAYTMQKLRALGYM
ncbi:MAG TPA: sulfate adenylyltransferase subunit CysD [Candidatus Brocadiia bacterium]|nr:sulfate adenylyltransferase subunit CysD [Candidatus Brocadiia bacterium]